MALTRKDYELEGKMYSMLLPPVTQALPLCTRAAVLVGSIASVFSGGTAAISGDGKLEIILGKIAGAMKLVDPVAMNALMMDAVKVSHLTCDNTSISEDIDFERHFSSYRGEVYQVLIWVLWETVQDFFPNLGGIAQVAKEAAKDMLQSQTAGQ